jgi:hypothetical protein
MPIVVSGQAQRETAVPIELAEQREPGGQSDVGRMQGGAEAGADADARARECSRSNGRRRGFLLRRGRERQPQRER